MPPRDLLGVLVRLAGLGFIQVGLFDLYYVVVKALGIQTVSQVPLWQDFRGYVLYCGWGLLLIFGSKFIVTFAYWGEAPDRKAG